jgi:D-proline reductase (dithiol) PrdB
MSTDLEKFKTAYAAWVQESLPAFYAGNMKTAVQKYPLVTPEDIPWTPFKGKLSDKTVALITSGGLYLKGSQPAFDMTTIHGDASFREIPGSIDPDQLGIEHPHYDHESAELDINTIFPIHRFKELEREGVVGKITDTHYSFSYVNDVAPLVTKTGPEMIRRLKTAGVDTLFLVPV